MELLAPAGDMACLEAAIDAGADAVYLGLSLLNARRSARNFTPPELERAVEIAEKHHVKTYLTLNIDITVRETGAAARILSLARDAGVSALIVRDLAAVELWRVMADLSARSGCHCPALHLSTQTSITNTEGVKLAAELGAKRVVLARELALSEIQAIRAKSDIEIEVFAQGALCYSISGRCLMSSWGGGRSGNRGLCTSPCRAPWSVDGAAVGTAMSMHDLVTVDRLRELSHAGVSAIKIEGRLKKPEWVRDAVSLYRAALGPRERAKESPPEDATPEAVDKARRLAAYAGRDITSAYLDGSFRGLTGVAARKSQSLHRAAIDELESEPVVENRNQSQRRAKEGYELSVNVSDSGVSCRIKYRDASESWRMPKTRIKREKKAVSVSELFERLSTERLANISLSGTESNEPDFMLPPRNVKAIMASIGSFLNRLSGKDDGSSTVMKAPLPEDMRKSARVAGRSHRDNRRILGEKPNQVRVTVKQLNSTLLPILKEVELIILGAGLEDMEFVEKFIDPTEAVFSFPEIFFPAESGKMRKLAEYFRDKNIRVEANCWGSLWLCRKYGLRFSTGPGIPVLNHVAAGFMHALGAESVTVSVEADKRQIEDIVAASPAPLSLLVYARPPLAYTRIPEENLLANGDRSADGEWVDRRGITVHPERNASVTVFRSLTPFSWAGIVNKKIRVANIVMDLSADAFPVTSWKNFIKPPLRDEFLFNYNRGLK